MTNYVVVMGSFSEGFTVVGPFATAEKAQIHAVAESRHSADVWWVTEMYAAPASPDFSQEIRIGMAVIDTYGEELANGEDDIIGGDLVEIVAEAYRATD